VEPVYKNKVFNIASCIFKKKFMLLITEKSFALQELKFDHVAKISCFAHFFLLARTDRLNTKGKLVPADDIYLSFSSSILEPINKPARFHFYFTFRSVYK
jgi:hypothetical protein